MGFGRGSCYDSKLNSISIQKKVTAKNFINSFFVAFSLGKHTYPACLFSLMLPVLDGEVFGWLKCVLR